MLCVRTRMLECLWVAVHECARVWLYYRSWQLSGGLIVADLCDVWIKGFLWQLMVVHSVKDKTRSARQRQWLLMIWSSVMSPHMRQHQIKLRLIFLLFTIMSSKCSTTWRSHCYVSARPAGRLLLLLLHNTESWALFCIHLFILTRAHLTSEVVQRWS